MSDHRWSGAASAAETGSSCGVTVGSGSPDSQGIGQFGLMGYGLFTAGGLVPAEPCAFNRMLMGWATPYEVDPDAVLADGRDLLSNPEVATLLERRTTPTTIISTPTRTRPSRPTTARGSSRSA